MPKILTTTVSVYPFKIQNGRPLYLILHRRKDLDLGNTWQVVHGRIKGREKAYDTALRELEEETGLKPSSIKLWVLDFIEVFYTQKEDSIKFVSAFAALVKNTDAKIKLSAEHNKYMWATFEVAKSKFIWQVQKNCIEILHRDIAMPIAKGKSTSLNKFLEVKC